MTIHKFIGRWADRCVGSVLCALCWDDLQNAGIMAKLDIKCVKAVTGLEDSPKNAFVIEASFADDGAQPLFAKPFEIASVIALAIRQASSTATMIAVPEAKYMRRKNCSS